MRGNSRWIVLLCACAAAAAIVWPSDVYAQRRAVRVYRPRPAVVYRSRPAVFLSAGFYSWPYYAPYYWGWYPYPYGFYPGYYPGYYAYRDYLSSARVQVTPRDAQVYLDGYFVGTVDDFDGFFQRLRIEPGEHEIQLYREGYRTITEKVLFRPGQTYHVKYTMQQLPSGAPPEPRPRPAPGAARQERPRDYGSGARRMPPTGPEYPPSSRAPEGPPPPDREAPPPPPERGDVNATFGTLSIRVQPGDATIVVDGERWEGPQGGSRLIIQVPEGSHRIEVHKDGYKDFNRSVDVRRGEVTTLNVSLVSEEQS